MAHLKIFTWSPALLLSHRTNLPANAYLKTMRSPPPGGNKGQISLR